jgi:hypothetical protein
MLTEQDLSETHVAIKRVQPEKRSLEVADRVKSKSCKMLSEEEYPEEGKIFEECVRK